MKCIVCYNEIDGRGHDAADWYGGHNVKAIADKRCCADCNNWFVIPQRLKKIRAVVREKMEGES
jgi:hypothetical protein